MTGCASEPKTVVKVDPGIVKLSEAADQIAESYRVLSYAESARNTKNGAADPGQRYDPEDFPPEWRKEWVLSEPYYGELEPFLRGLSRLAGYDEPQIIGKRPVNPVIISMNKSRRALADFLVDASYQSRNRANITVSEGNNRLRIAY
ncbi:type IV secretion protein DotD [Marinobacter halodurans]|uniref:Type IV secretion protein DotD n=2 Tax=Marinobacter halodurans TaxID=2528979 RepID=A0ABY1ZMG1_9GAMM|nr:type IV secretion protein DotD [Marinobacter halodurans]